MSFIKQLAGLLGQTAALYEKIAEACSREQQAIQEMDMAALTGAAGEKETLALKLKVMDESRRVLAEKITAASGLKGRDASLKEIAAAAQTRAERAELAEAGERLSKAAARAREQSDFSRRLIGRALDTVVETMRFANTLAGGETATYASRGGVGSRVRSGVVVERSF